jgi:hypothetical protein
MIAMQKSGGRSDANRAVQSCPYELSTGTQPVSDCKSTAPR